ncbi:SKP1/BTB/POZ domain [Phytophthora cactorum]|nr:SKP1/BTB/POZ domain [Phytophthora cactorum]
MARRRDSDENEDANVVTDYDDLLDEMFTERSDTSEKDLGLTISIDWSDIPIETRHNEAELASTRSNDASTESMDSDNPSTTNSAAERLPLLLRATSQGAYFDFRSLDPDHTVGRTRVPWHSKSISDLRDPDTKPTRIVAFDVGGKLFRCKESLIAKYPLKRLNQIITCGCGKISCLDDAFFIDRNPQHFEMILDWYRTGKLVRQRNVDEEAFKDDAIYFDLFEEMFPATPSGDPPQSWPTTKAPPGLPVRRRSVNDVDLGPSNTKRVSMFANMPSPPVQQKKPEPLIKTEDEEPQDVALPTATDDGPLRFLRRERRVLTPTSIPLVFMTRKFEQLLVESVKGRGKLMVRVCDATGMQKVDVPEAVLFDSHSRFYLRGRRAQLQHNALLPGDHVYTFWMEENSSAGSVQASTPPALDVDFKLIFTFDPDDRITHTMEAELARVASDGNDAIRTLTPEGNPPSNGRTNSYSPCLFMPPKRDPELISLPDDTSTTQPSKNLSPLAQTKTNGVKRGNQQHDVKSSPIRHAGASIVRGGQLPHPRPAQGKITVYRPDKLDLDPASECPTFLGLHHSESSDRRSNNQAVESVYHEMQPRLFR